MVGGLVVKGKTVWDERNYWVFEMTTYGRCLEVSLRPNCPSRKLSRFDEEFHGEQGK